MDLMQIGAQLLMKKFGMDDSNSDNVIGALTGLLGGQGGNLDLGGLVSGMMSNGGLQSVVSSWLGDGDNEAISGDQVSDMFGGQKVSDFASQLGIDEGTAKEGLAEAIPQMIDSSSSGGSLLDAVGGVGGVMNMAKKFF